MLELANGSVPAIAAVRQGQLVKVGAVVRVDGVRPAEVIVERDGQERGTDQGSAVEVDPGRDALRLVPDIKICPGQMRVGQEQGVPAFGARRREGPRVRAVGVPVSRLVFDTTKKLAGIQGCVGYLEPKTRTEISGYFGESISKNPSSFSRCALGNSFMSLFQPSR